MQTPRGPRVVRRVAPIEETSHPHHMDKCLYVYIIHKMVCAEERSGERRNARREEVALVATNRLNEKLTTVVRGIPGA